MHRFLLIAALSAMVIYASAQGLYMPRNIQLAYKKGTRSPDGNPGPNYWQNHATYNITVTARPPGRDIVGSEEIVYTNNSTDTLRTLVFRLILNIHKPGAQRNTPTDSAYLTNGLIIDKLVISGEPVNWGSSANDATTKTIFSPKPLAPHDSVHIMVNWHYQVSLESNREGMIDSTTYFLAYCYPRITVFDDYNHWDRVQFTDIQEFYSDFNDYELTVNAPKNYVVWATGNLQNPADVLQPAAAQRLQASMVTDSLVHVATLADMLGHTVTAQNDMNSWKFKAEGVPDIAIALSGHFVWDASSTIVDDATQRRVSVQGAFNDTCKDFHQETLFANYSLNWLSHNWPGVPYPYPKMTFVQGFADMEYPMMINDNTNQDIQLTRFIADHEIAHTYFPFYMGINESRYAFMDEGWATTFELLIGSSWRPQKEATDFYKNFRIKFWASDPSSEEDFPITTVANGLQVYPYANNAYGKPSLGYFAVKDMLGDDLFKKCLQGYMQRWHGKHPIPWDFFNSFNNISGKDLNWFWNNWFFTNGYIDLAIQNASKEKKGYAITVQNIGGYTSPFDVVVTYADGTTSTTHENAFVWQANQKQTVVKVEADGKKEVKSIKLDGGIFMDYDESNNVWNK